MMNPMNPTSPMNPMGPPSPGANDPLGAQSAPGAVPAMTQQQQARQKMMSDALRTGATTAPQGQMVGNRYVAPSATQTLGQLANAAGYAYLNRGG